VVACLSYKFSEFMTPSSAWREQARDTHVKNPETTRQNPTKGAPIVMFVVCFVKTTVRLQAKEKWKTC